MRRLTPVLLIVMVSCLAPAQTFPVQGTALAGPVCPVETNPPDPACEPRPVTDAIVKAQDINGTVLASAATDFEGRFTLDLPPGEYTVVGQPVEGMMGSPDPVQITVQGGPVDVGVLSYDTGIR